MSLQLGIYTLLKMSSKLLLLLLFIPVLCIAQERTLMRGRVISGNLGIKNALLVNFSAQAETHTDSLGYFTIKAKTGDLLIAAAYNIEEKK